METINKIRKCTVAKRAINIQVGPRYKDEPVDRMIKRFLKKVKKEKVLEKHLEKQYYEKPSLKRKKTARKRKKVLDKLKEKNRQ